MNKLPWRREGPRLLWHRLLWLAIAAMVPLALIAGLGAAVLLWQQRTQAEHATLDFTRAFANAIQTELDRSTTVLRVLASSPLLDSGDAAPFRERLVSVLDTLPDWQAIVLADPSGRVIAHTTFADVATAPALVDRESFQRVLVERKAVVGFLAKAPQGDWRFPIRYPVVRDGNLKYVLSGVLKPEAVLSVVQRQRVPHDWVVSVFDAHDARIARSRGHEQWIGTGPSPTLKQLMSSSATEGMGVAVALEGDRIFSAYVRLPEARWTVATGTPTAAFEADLVKTVAIYGGVIGLSLLIAAMLAWLFAKRITHPIAELRDAAVAVGRGELPQLPRADIVEVNDVAQTLAEAARERTRHEAEREALLEQAQSAQAQAESANRAKDEFLAMLGHELRNPLAPIVTSLELMQMRLGDVGAHERGIIERQVKHLSRLVDDLLDVARIAQGKVQLDLHCTDLRAVIENALELTAPITSRRETIELDLPEAPLWVNGDELRLVQVVFNLLVNAIKFTPPRGAIRLQLAAQGGDAVLTVSDEGSGIAPSLLPHVFDLFVQGEQALDRQGGGLGLGLGIVKTLVELHGGSVTAESPGAGGGSRFTVRLPCTPMPASEAAARPPDTAETPPRTARVLLVDDNVDAAQSLAELLRIYGYQVRAVYDGASALATLGDDFSPDVALLDIGLPGMDGYELATRLRSDARVDGMSIIAITGYGREPDRARALDAQFDAHLVKPVDIGDVIEAIERHARRP